MIVVPFDPSHLRGIKVQPAQEEEFSIQSEAISAMYGAAWTALDGNRVMACAGIMPIWNGRHYLWGLLSADAGVHMVGLTRAALRELRRIKGRVEMYVDEGFEPGMRWAEMLGFELETPQPMRGYLPSGRGAYLYARVT